MIRIIRSPKPFVLVRKETAWLAALNRASTPAEKENAQSKYRNSEIRQVLQSMFHGKCAYCESKITHVSYAHIEHYRPKSRFEDLTFDWNNLLLACGICNSAEYKGDRFPEAQDGGPLINPCSDEPADHFLFVYDPLTKLASVYGKTRQGLVTEDLLGLNRPELRTYRSRQVSRLFVLARLAQTDAEAKLLLDEAKLPESEYAAFVRGL